MQVNIKSKNGRSAVVVAPNSDSTINLTDSAPEDRVVEEFLNYFPQIDSGVLPVALRYLSDDRRIICFEQPPRYISFPVIWKHMDQIEAGGGSDKYSKHDITIPLPWLLYCAYLSPRGDPLNIYVFTLQHQLNSLDDEIRTFSFLNFYDDSRLCRAPGDMAESEFGATIQGAFEAIYNAVWLTGFNHDNSHHLLNYVKSKQISFLVKMGNHDLVTMLDWWSKASLSAVSQSTWPSNVHKTLRTFLASGSLVSTVAETFDMSRFFVSRVSSAYQNID